MHRRLERLEARTPRQQGYQVPRHMERFFHAMESARRELEGLEPLPDLECTEEDYQDAMNTIAAYRAEPGWQIGEAKAFLDQWEQETRERMERRT